MNSPVVLSTANKQVYSAHDYGPTEYGQSWFNGSTTPASLSAVWTTHWRYVAKNAAGGCHVAYSVPNDWRAGFTGAIAITNSGATALTSWSLQWRYTANQQLSQAWNANYTQSGTAVTLTSLSYTGFIAVGRDRKRHRLQCELLGTNVAPTAFYLNGVLCH